MIDLEHQALNAGSPAEPDARDARGWFRLDLRPDGSLWAVGVTWTPDGAQRLSEKRQRYISPAFTVDPDTSRITSIINAAIVAIPATHDTPALVAASARGDGSMDAELVKRAIDALVADDAQAALEILKGLVVSAAGGDAAAEEPPADTEAEPLVEAAVPQALPEEEPKEKPEVVAAASARLMRLSGKSSLVDAIAETEVWRTSHLTLESETQKLAAERATFEMAERRKLCVELVTLRAEFPSTIWADDKATTLKPRWLKMDLAELRSHCAEQRAARGGKAPTDPVPPVVGGDSADGGKEFNTPSGPVKLSARELSTCAELKVDPTVYAADKAARKKG